jgi:predicted DNA-binding WGR domain protein
MAELEPPSTLQILLKRVDPDRNMARYYVISIAATLFCENTLIREWGRIGLFGQSRHEYFDQLADAREALETWLSRKTRRGYVISR